MVCKYAVMMLAVLVFGRVAAQESMLPNVSDEFMNKLVALATENYPKAKAIRERTKITELGIKKAKMDWYNIVSFSYLYTPGAAGSTVVTNIGQSFLSGYSIGLSTSIGNILMKPGLIAAAKKEYELAQLDEGDYLLGLATAVKTRYYAYMSQRTALSLKSRTKEINTLIANNIRYKYEKGEETFDNYNKALAASSSAEQAVIECETALLIAKCSLEELIGVKLETVK
jgi:outer membrane protein TolC